MKFLGKIKERSYLELKTANDGYANVAVYVTGDGHLIEFAHSQSSQTASTFFSCQNFSKVHFSWRQHLICSGLNLTLIG